MAVGTTLVLLVGTVMLGNGCDHSLNDQLNVGTSLVLLLYTGTSYTVDVIALRVGTTLPSNVQLNVGTTLALLVGTVMLGNGYDHILNGFVSDIQVLLSTIHDISVVVLTLLLVGALD